VLNETERAEFEGLCAKEYNKTISVEEAKRLQVLADRNWLMCLTEEERKFNLSQ
jgi:hypothetical protein